MASSILPSRAKHASADDGTDSPEDTSETSKLFTERLEAWKHACAYLEDYVATTEKMQHAHHKEYEKVLKTIAKPIKEGDHFDSRPGGVNDMLDNMRSNTQRIANAHLETAKILKSSVLPIFQRLASEIKSKQKDIVKTVGKGSKGVDKARAATQKHVELLGQHSATTGSASKSDPHHDPYVLQKGIFHRLGKQIGEENAIRQDMLTVQSNFSQFEAHVMQAFQQGMGQFAAAVGGQADTQKGVYSAMAQNISTLNPQHEWQAFVQRKSNVLIDPNGPQRTLANSSFPKQGHASTQALCQGSLERKSGLIKKWEPGFYAITPAGFLHEFKSDDDATHEPKPETSLYLAECQMGGLNGAFFNIKGKDRSSKLPSTYTEYAFKAHNEADARQWYEVLESVVARHGSSTATGTSRVSSTKSMGSGKGTDATSSSSPLVGNEPDIRRFTEHEKGQDTVVTKDDRHGGVQPGQETGIVGGGSGSGVSGQPGQY